MIMNYYSNYLTCTNCGTKNHNNCQFCEDCGTNLITQHKYKMCFECIIKYDDLDYNYCANCGHILSLCVPVCVLNIDHNPQPTKIICLGSTVTEIQIEI